MKPKSYYIAIFSALFIASIAFFIFFTTNWHSSFSQIFISIILIIYFLWMSVKKFRERNLPSYYNYKRVFAAVGLMLLMAAILIFAASLLQNKPLTKTQKERIIIK